jgi:hypothetical protein
MAWSFARSGGQKSPAQLQREAAVVLALGGGFQAYFTQRRDGSIKLDQIPVMAEVAKFCRARQAVCHRALPVPQVAVLYSTAAHYRDINGLFSRDLTHIRGTLQALLESQLSVEVLGEHHLKGHLSEYPLIVVPECSYLEPEFKQELLTYVQGGGHLLLVGPQSAALFQPELGIQLEGNPQAETRYLAWGDALTPTKGLTQSVKLESKAKAVGQLHAANDPQSPAQPAASVVSLGQGQIAATYFAFSQGYIENRSDKSRGFLNELARQLFPKPLVEVKGSSDLDVSVNRIGGRLAVNLVNTAGPHAQTPLFDSIPPVGPLEITIRADKKPEKVTLEPGSQIQSFEYRDAGCSTASEGFLYEAEFMSCVFSGGMFSCIPSHFDLLRGRESSFFSTPSFSGTDEFSGQWDDSPGGGSEPRGFDHVSVGGEGAEPGEQFRLRAADSDVVLLGAGAL